MSPGAIELTQPAWLWLLLLLGGMALAWRRWGRRDEHTGLSGAAPYSHLRFLHPLADLVARSGTGEGIRSVVRSIVTWAALVLLVIALTQPVRIGAKLPDPPRERDIVFIVDASVSMVLRDYVLDGQRIDRMTVLKGVLDRFVQGLEGDRMSVIVFADSAYTMIPLTSDQQLLRRMLSRIETGIAGRTNALGEAIALAAREAGGAPERRRLLVLLTDAVLPGGRITPAEGAALAAAHRLPLYTVAIGAGTYAAEEERIIGLIYEPADLALLEQLAEETGARSYQAGDTDSLRQAIDDIEQREKHAAVAPPRYYREPLYQWPLLLGLLILSLGQAWRLLRRAGAS